MSASSLRRLFIPIMVVAALFALALVTLFPSKTDSLKQSRIALAAFQQRVMQTAKPADQIWARFKLESASDTKNGNYKALYQAANQTYDAINKVGITLAAIPVPKLHNTHARQAAWKALEDTRAKYTMLAAAAQVWIKMADSQQLDSDELTAIKGVEKQADKYQHMIPDDFALAHQALATPVHQQ